jgi:phosphate-selective porin OprO/OprP
VIAGRRFLSLAAAACWLASASAVHAQGNSAPPPAPAAEDEGKAEGEGELNAAEADDPKTKKTHWNEYDGKYFSVRAGIGFLIDYAGYEQDADSTMQMDLESTGKLRDFRFLLKGKLKFLGPRVSYSVGYMFDAVNDMWRFRQSGIMVAIPELGGSVFVGRTKEGFSTYKLTTGYNLFTNERSVANDAFLPILADGIKWMGKGFNGKFLYNVGVFSSILNREQSYTKNDEVVAARTVYLPYATKRDVLHLALEGRYGNSKGGTLQFKAKPESYPAQENAVDTGMMPATGNLMGGVEAYWEHGPFILGMEYYLNQVYSSETDNPFFHGGEVFGAWLLTGEVREYNANGGYFEQIYPKKGLLQGGPGAIELVLRFSYADLKSGPVDGGRFWRITPMVNWYLSDYLRLELGYGYGMLDRMEVKGNTHFFLSRIQISFM